MQPIKYWQKTPKSIDPLTVSNQASLKGNGIIPRPISCHGAYTKHGKRARNREKRAKHEGIGRAVDIA